MPSELASDRATAPGFVYLVEGMDYVVVVFLIQMLTLYFEGSVVAVTKVFPGLNTAFECSLTLS